MRVLTCAVGFGLGPSGKMASIISLSNDEWYACGDRIDVSIYGSSPFVDCCWSRRSEDISLFVHNHRLEIAIVILDPEIASMLVSLGLTVIYIDSIPFIWTKKDPIPYNVSYYCAQKYPDYNYNLPDALRPVSNLLWINPIIYSPPTSYKPSDYTVINFGGLHSPYGDGTEYLKIVLTNLLPCLKGEKIIITGGDNVVQFCKNHYPSIICKTFCHDIFLSLVSNAKSFYTSPGLTTIYETCHYGIPTVLLPPQNLSQMYNSKIGERILPKFKVISWNDCVLSDSFPSRYANLPESYAVECIYDRINTLLGMTEYLSSFKHQIASVVKADYSNNPNYERKQNGAYEILELLHSI